MGIGALKPTNPSKCLEIEEYMKVVVVVIMAHSQHSGVSNMISDSPCNNIFLKAISYTNIFKRQEM